MIPEPQGDHFQWAPQSAGIFNARNFVPFLEHAQQLPPINPLDPALQSDTVASSTFYNPDYRKNEPIYIPQLEPQISAGSQGPVNPFASIQRPKAHPEKKDPVERLVQLLLQLQRLSKTWDPSSVNATDLVNLWEEQATVNLFKASKGLARILESRTQCLRNSVKAYLGPLLNADSIRPPETAEFPVSDGTSDPHLTNRELPWHSTPRDRIAVSLIKDCYDLLVYMFDTLVEIMLSICQQSRPYPALSSGRSSGIATHTPVSSSILENIQKVSRIFERIDRAMRGRNAQLPYVCLPAMFPYTHKRTHSNGHIGPIQTDIGGTAFQASSGTGGSHSDTVQAIEWEQCNALDELRRLDWGFRERLARVLRLLQPS